MASPFAWRVSDDRLRRERVNNKFDAEYVKIAIDQRHLDVVSTSTLSTRSRCGEACHVAVHFAHLITIQHELDWGHFENLQASSTS